MKSKDFINAALLEMNKIYNIRKEIITQKLKKPCDEALKDFSYYRGRDMTSDEKALLALGGANNNIIHTRARFYSWSKSNVGHNRTDEEIVRDVKRFIQSIEVCMNNRFTDYKLDPTLEEAKEGLEALVVLAELVV